VASPDLIIASNANAFNIPNGLLRYFFIGNYNVHLYPDNLINAAIEPVNVIPPISVPMKAAIR
jgi:hypothetical protein